MNCNDIQNRLDDFLDGTLAGPLSDELGAHVAECTSCRNALANAQTLMSAFRQLPVADPSEGFEDRVLQQAVERAAAKPRVSRVAAGGFAAAVAAGLLTVALIVTGPSAPSGDADVDFPVVAVTVDQPQIVNLVFASNSAIDDVSLVVELPEGVEIAGYAGRREVFWRTSMQAGKNVLPLELVARASVSGELVARLEHGDMARTFRIFVSAAAG